MRTTRNELYGHSAAAAISDADFLNQWSVVEASIKAIAQCCNDADFENHIAKYIDNVKTGPLDIDSIVQVFKQWCRNEDRAQSKLDAIKETVDDVSETVKGKGNIVLTICDPCSLINALFCSLLR